MMYKSILSAVISISMFAIFFSTLWGDGGDVGTVPHPFGLHIVDDTQHPDPPDSNPEGYPGVTVTPDARATAYFSFKTTITDYIDAHGGEEGPFEPSAGTVMGGTLVQGSLLDGNAATNIEGDIVVPDLPSYVRVYFLSERAAFANTLGFVLDENFDLTDVDNENSLIFPTVNEKGGIADLDRGWAKDPDPNPEALHPDDYVDLGLVAAGEKVNFFFIPDGADVPDGTIPETDSTVGDEGTWPVWWTEDDQNFDSSRHAHIVKFMSDSTLYYLLGFEDTSPPANNDPTDFNDILAVVEVVPIPEPKTYILLGTFLVVVYFLKRSRKTRMSEA